MKRASAHAIRGPREGPLLGGNGFATPKTRSRRVDALVWRHIEALSATLASTGPRTWQLTASQFRRVDVCRYFCGEECAKIAKNTRIFLTSLDHSLYRSVMDNFSCAGVQDARSARHRPSGPVGKEVSPVS